MSEATTTRGTDPETASETDRAAASATKGHGFRHWRRQRPFIGGVLVALGGIELFFSGQLDTGNLHIQLGIEGLQATIIPIVLVALGVIAIAMPAHHVFYGIIALVIAIYSLVGVNLGGFILGMVLATVGAILVVAWMGPPKAPEADSATAASETDGSEATASTASDGEGIS